MTGQMALNQLIVKIIDENTKVNPSDCVCNNCITCWHRIILDELKKSRVGMQETLEEHSLSMQQFLDAYTMSMLGIHREFVENFFSSITEEDKKRLIQLSIKKLEEEKI